MVKMMEYLRNDTRMQQLRKEWKEKFTEPFPGWNYDCYDGIEEYKQRIGTALDVGDYAQFCERCVRKKCKTGRLSKFRTMVMDRQ